MNNPIEIYQEADAKTSIQLDPLQGEQIRSLIIKNSNQPFNRYVEAMGLQPTNVANYLSGRNRISLSTLSRLLAGINHNFQCLLHVTISTGETVNDADSIPLEEMLLLQEPEVSTEVVPICVDSLPTFCSSVQHRRDKTITQADPSPETQVESSTSSSSTLSPTSPIPLPILSDADQQQRTLGEKPSTEILFPQRLTPAPPDSNNWSQPSLFKE